MSVQVYYFSREYPEYTGGQSEFNDKLRFRVSYPNGTIASGWTTVNALHDFFDTGRYPGGNYLAADRVIRFGSLTGTDDSWIEVRAVAMNVSDAFLGSGVAIVIDCRIIDLDIEGVSEGAETNPGGFVCLNDDDDNNNNVPDKDESGAITGEDDLLVLSTSVADGLTGTVTLSAPAGGTRIRVYENSNRSGLIGLARSWSVDQLPSKFYVEGVSRSAETGDVTMRLKFGGAGTVCKDEIKLTVTPTTTVPGNYDTVEIRYKTFIAPQAVKVSAFAVWLWPFYEGDGRWFSFAADRSASRTFQTTQVTVNPNNGNGQVGTPTNQFGTTRGYNDDPTGSDVFPCVHCAGPYGDWCLAATRSAECADVAIPGQNGNVLNVVHTRINDSEVKVDMAAVGKNPCASAVPAIDVNLTIHFRQLCVNGVLQTMQFRLYGNHDGFPWHELYINGTQIYTHDPCCTFEGPGSLVGSGEHLFEATDLCHLQNPPLNDWRQVPGLP